MADHGTTHEFVRSEFVEDCCEECGNPRTATIHDHERTSPAKRDVERFTGTGEHDE